MPLAFGIITSSTISRATIAHELEPGRAVGCAPHREAVVSKREREQLADMRLVVDDRDARRHSNRSASIGLSSAAFCAG